jgi:hypothetical protein
MLKQSTPPNDFANEWIRAWNSHDLEQILSLYDEEVKFSSPLLAKINPDTGGVIQGKRGLRSYWGRVLTLRPELWFKLIDALYGVNRLVLQYQRFDGQICAESFVFDTCGKVIESHAHEKG